MACLLHAVPEDCGSGHEQVIRARFGDAVARIVSDCTDGSAGSKDQASTADWRLSDSTKCKLDYIANLSAATAESLPVSACGKLHNARAILADLQGDTGLPVFERFTTGFPGTLQNYDSIARILLERSAGTDARLQEPAREFDRILGQMHGLAGTKALQRLCGNSLVS